MIRKTGIPFTLPVPSQVCLLSLALLVLGSGATRAGSREPSGKAAPNVTPALNRTPRGIQRPLVKPLDLKSYTGYWILEDSKRDTLSSRSPAGDDKYQLDAKAERAGPHTYVGSLKLRDILLRPRSGQPGTDRIPFTYEAAGTMVFDDPPAVVPNGTNWDVSLRITLKETCSESWPEAAAAITARLGPLPPLAVEGDQPRHVYCWAGVTGSEKDRTRVQSADDLAPTGPTRCSAADGKPWSESVPVRFPLIPKTLATTAERFLLILDATTPAGACREQHVYRWTKDLPPALEPELRRQVSRANFQGVRSGRPEPLVWLRLTCPTGLSPKVFTSGWVFGAKCLVTGPKGESTDLSGKVQWTGTGTFTPLIGPLYRPAFTAPGANSITLSVPVEGKVITKTYPVVAVSPAGYAGAGGKAQAPADAHGCPACPHPVVGPITTGSPWVFIGGRPAARLGDTGIHAACCGPNIFEIVGGDPEVLIDGRPAAKVGSPTKHCGGAGTIISAGP